MDTGQLLNDAEYCRNECLIFKEVEKLQAENQALRGNPWCLECKEKDCCVSQDGTCAWIRTARKMEAENESLKQKLKENHNCKFSESSDWKCEICGTETTKEG